MTKRAGLITTIIRIPRTRWSTANSDDNAIFASIDSNTFYGVSQNAALGDELEICAEGSRSFPIGASKLWVMQLSEGYMKGLRDWTIESIYDATI